MLVLLAYAAPGVSAGAPAATPAPTPGATADLRFRDVVITPDSLALGDVAVVRFSVIDQSDLPVSGLTTNATLRAPSTQSTEDSVEPVITAFGRSLADPGRYEASVALNQIGSWWLEIDARDGQGHVARANRFLTVDPVRATPTAPVANPVFLQGDTWGTYYRLDPTTGSVARLTGQSLIQAGTRQLVVNTTLTPEGTVSSAYGGTWRLKVALTDGPSGQPAGTFDLGDVRASVYLGSVDQPAIASAVTVDPAGSRVYTYWSRQLGQGWLAAVSVGDLRTNEVLHTTTLHGAIAADGTWARLDLAADGSQLVVSEQVVKTASVVGYRLTALDPQTLDPLAEYRRTNAPDDPLARCVLSSPLPSGPVGDDPSLRYSLCTPQASRGPSLVTWDPLKGAVVRQVDLASLAADNPSYVDGVASPDGTRFYAVNALSRQLVEVDLRTGATLRRVSLVPNDQSTPTPSTWERFRDWLTGKVSRAALAGVIVRPGLAIAPDGATLYLVAPVTAATRSQGDGIWVINAKTLQVSAHLLSGQSVSGLVVGPDGRLAVVRQDSSSSGEDVVVVRPDGQTLISLSLPDRIASTSTSR
jgi:hypothetical protein